MADNADDIESGDVSDHTASEEVLTIIFIIFN